MSRFYFLSISGASKTEYALAAGLIGAVVLGMVVFAGGKISSVFSGADESLIIGGPGAPVERRDEVPDPFNFGEKVSEDEFVAVAEYGPGLLQRLHRIPSDTLIYDLQFRLRCQHCNRRGEFDIGILDTRSRGDNRQPRMERPVVQRSSERH